METDIDIIGENKMALENVVNFPSAEESGLSHLGITIDTRRDKDLSEQAYKITTRKFKNKIV